VSLLGNDLLKKHGLTINANKFVAYKKAISNFNLSLILAIAFLIFAIIGLICATISVTVFGVFTSITEYIQIALSACLIGFALLMWRERNDVFFLKQEFIATAIVGIVSWLTVAFSKQLDVRFVLTFDVIITMHFFILGIIVLVIPLIRSYFPPPLIFRLGKISSFKDVLDNNDLRRMYTAHLIKELSIENMLFYNNVEELKLLEDDAKKKRLAEDLLNKFINVGSPYEINIDNQLRRRTTEELQRDSFDGFYSVQKYIYKLLSEDSYPRFLKSQELKAWTTSIVDLKKTVDTI